MSLLQLSGLSVVYLCCLVFVLVLAGKEFRRARFNFHLFFTLLFLAPGARASDARGSDARASDA